MGINVKSGTSENLVVNKGVINQNGQNSIGIDVEAGGKITHAGVININSGVDEGTHYANYGIRASGEDAHAVVSGQVNLNGDYAIGVQARDKGTITLVGDGTVTFNGGSNQTGYYIYGLVPPLSTMPLVIKRFQQRIRRFIVWMAEPRLMVPVPISRR